MPRVQVGYEPGAAALQTTASPNQQAIKAQFDPNSSTAFQLAEALGKAKPIIDDFQQKYERDKFVEGQLQQLKKQSYQEQFNADKANGVTAVQVGERNPETVPLVRAQVAEGVGQTYGKESAQPIIQGILQNETLRLDTDARAAHLAEARKTFYAGLKGDDFYKNGAMQAYDQEVKQYENTWQRETATYHTNVLEEKLGREVVDTLKNGGDLLKLDETWKSNNGLGNASRNKVVVDTIINQAFAADDPRLLDKIDVRFRNAESDAKIQKMRILIQEKRMATVRDAEYLKGLKKDETLRNDKVGMINQVASGQPVDPARYRDNPEAFAFAMSMKDAGRLPDVQSVSNATRVRTAILNGSTVGSMNQNQVIDQIMSNPAINPKEKQALIADVPKLMEGMILLNDEGVKVAMSTRIDARLKVLEGSTNARIQSLITGGNLRAQAMQVFEQGLQSGFTAFFETNKAWPTGTDKRNIIREETEKTERLLEELTRIGTQANPATTAPAPAPAAAAPKPATKPAAKPTPSADDIAYAKKNPAVRQKFIDTFGREP